MLATDKVFRFCQMQVGLLILGPLQCGVFVVGMAGAPLNGYRGDILMFPHKGRRASLSSN